MQTNLVYLYQNKIEVQLSDAFSVTRYRIVYAADLVIHKGMDNVLNFQFKNADQQRVPIGDKEFSLRIFDERDAEKQLLIDLPLTMVDENTGAATVTIPEQYLNDVELGKYKYAILVHTNEGLTISSYVDDNYGVRGNVEVALGAEPKYRESSILTFNETTNLTDVVGEVSKINQNNGLHTVLLKFTEFTGSLVVEATMDNVTDQLSPANFFEVASVDFVNQNEAVTLNFNGVFSGIRFAQGVSSGDITEVQYRY